MPLKTLKWNGEYWYEDNRTVWKRLRQWAIWIGGWEVQTEQLTAGAWTLWRGKEPTPVALLGHRVTWYGHWFQARTPWGVLVVRFARDERGRMKREIESAYISHNGTPGGAHVWIVGADHHVLDAINRRRRMRAVP